MNRLSLIFLVSTGLLFVLGCADKSTENDASKFKSHPPVSAIGEVFQNKDGNPYVRMLTIDGAEPNKRFSKRLSTFSGKMQNFNGLKKQYADESDEEAKKELETKLKQLQKEINNIKRKMMETYGVSLDRPYLVVIEKAELYLDTEAPSLSPDANSTEAIVSPAVKTIESE